MPREQYLVRYGMSEWASEVLKGGVGKVSLNHDRFRHIRRGNLPFEFHKFSQVAAIDLTEVLLA